MITIIVVGNIKEPSLKQLILEYEKRLANAYRVQWVQIPESKKHKANFVGVHEESANILKKIKADDVVYLCDVEGQSMDSLAFSKLLDQHFSYNQKRLVFVIGGSNGVNEAVKKRARARLSFSKLTFPHQLFRLLLVEQIYRSYTINHNITYHK